MITAAKRQMSPLARGKKGILDALVDYLCDGEGERVLATLADIPKAAVVMKLNCVKPPWERRSQMEACRKRFFELASKEDPVLLYRFAKIAEATAGTSVSPVWESLPDDLRWFDVLLNEALEICSWRCRNPLNWDMPLLQEILEVAGQPADLLPTLVLKVDTDDDSSAREAVLSMPGIAATLSQQGQAVGEALLQESAPGKVHALTELGRLKVSLAPHIDSVALLALDRAKSVREAAMEQLAHLDKAAVRQAIEGLASNGPAIQRQQAVQLLGERYGAESHEFLRGLAEGDRSQKVRQEIDRIVGVPELANTRDESPDQQPISPSSSKAAICEVIADAFAQAVTASDAAAHKASGREKSRRRPRGHRKIISKAIEFLRKGGQLKRFAKVLRPESGGDATWRPYRELVATQDLTLVGLWRLLHMLGCEGQGHTLSQNGTTLLLTYRLSHDPELDLRRLAAAAKAARLSGRFVAAMYLPQGRGAVTNALDLAPEAIWPFFAESPRYLVEALGTRQPGKVDCGEISEERERAFLLLAMLPQIPGVIVPILWDLALGTEKVDQARARDCLASFPNKEFRIIAALNSRKNDVRAVAANWLADLDHTDAAKAIKDALKNETCDVPKAAMISALERFGFSMEDYLNRTRLLEDAHVVLDRADPKIMAWFPSDQLPAVHWEDDQQGVAPEILHAFLVQACQLKSIEPSPLTQRYCEQMDPAERRAFGSFVLQAWLSEDTKRRYTPEEAAAKADRDATWYSGVYNDPDEVENYRKQCHQKYLSECAGGASASRGVLAIVACCADSSIVPTISDYLETYQGRRKSQCKSLLALRAQFHDVP
ncbi:MAG: HEAT repeat protein [Rhodothermales bacterium]|jgi:HEAT repeat protein